MMELISNGAFWIAVLQIIAIDILLGGDNAVVIALACRRLPEEQRNKGIFWGVFGAVGLRIILIFFALNLLKLPYLKTVGAVLLFWIGIKLLIPEDDDSHDIKESTHLLGAIKTIIIADAVMSLDNVIAVAGAADGDIMLVSFGIVISVPIIVWGSKFVLMLMDRFPIVITLGGGLLGWIAGQMLFTDIAFSSFTKNLSPLWEHVAAFVTAALVILIGTAIGRKSAVRAQEVSKN